MTPRTASQIEQLQGITLSFEVVGA
jgi:hypothetical protein